MSDTKKILLTEAQILHYRTLQLAALNAQRELSNFVSYLQVEHKCEPGVRYEVRDGVLQPSPIQGLFIDKPKSN